MPDVKDYDSLPPWTPRQEKFGKRLIKGIGKWQTAVYEFSGGRLWNKFMGSDCAILTTTGAKSGKPRKTPLLYLNEGSEIVVVASQGGFSTEPLWFKNLQVNPQAVIQIGSQKRRVYGRVANTEESAQLWPKLDRLYAGFKEYRARTRNIRQIPIVIFRNI